MYNTCTARLNIIRYIRHKEREKETKECCNRDHLCYYDEQISVDDCPPNFPMLVLFILFFFDLFLLGPFHFIPIEVNVVLSEQKKGEMYKNKNRSSNKRGTRSYLTHTYIQIILACNNKIYARCRIYNLTEIKNHIIHV